MFTDKMYDGLEIGPEHEHPGFMAMEPGHNNSQTTALIAASRRRERATYARRSSAERASINYSAETGHPLYITKDGEALKPEEVPKEVRHMLAAREASLETKRLHE